MSVGTVLLRDRGAKAQALEKTRISHATLEIPQLSCVLYLQFSVLSVSEGIVLNISERFTQTKSLIFVKYWCKLNKEQQICPKET